MHTLLHLNLKQAEFDWKHSEKSFYYKGHLSRFRHLHSAWKMSELIRKFGEFYMPKKRGVSEQTYGYTWVRVVLTDHEKADLQAWISKGSYDIGEQLALLMSEGEKISLSYNENQDSFYCTIMGSDNSHRNKGKGFSSFAKNPIDALLVAIFKYQTILEGDMSNASDTGSMGDLG